MDSSSAIQGVAPALPTGLGTTSPFIPVTWGGHDKNGHVQALFGAADALREAIGAPHGPAEREEWGLAVAVPRASLGDETFHAAWDEGRAMTPEEAVGLALREAGDA